MKPSLLAGSCLAALLAFPAFAGENHAARHAPGSEAYKEPPEASRYPSLSGEAVFELQFEHGVESDDPNNERMNGFGRSEIAPTLRFNEHIFLDGNIIVEPVQDTSTPGDDTFFEDEGAYIEELKLNYENGPWAASAGKIHPNFGLAWDYGRGVWSEDFAADYELSEYIGFGGAFTLETQKAGNHTLGASTFFTDTSALSESAVTRRENTQKQDGGAGNTEDFSSFVVSLDGENAGGIENLGYHLSFRHLAEADVSVGGDDEQGVAANVKYTFPLCETVELDTLAEFAGIDNFDGAADTDRRYYSASVVARIHQHWLLVVGGTARTIETAGAPDIDDHLLQVTGGYDFGNGLTLEAGWRGSEEASVDTDTLGGLARYTIGF